MMHEMFRLICFEYRAVSVEHFMHQMTFWEADVVLSCLEYTDRNLRETMRYQIYTFMQAHSKKQLKAEDVFKLPWDEAEHITEMTDTDRDEMARRMKEVMEQMDGAAADGRDAANTTQELNGLHS